MKYSQDQLDAIDGICDTLAIQSNRPSIAVLTGSAGTGKTTLAKIIANGLDADIMYINASDENNVDTVRTKIKNYASTIGFKKWKIVILDEADYMTPNGQAALRNLMETFSKTTILLLISCKTDAVVEYSNPSACAATIASCSSVTFVVSVSNS